MKVGLLTFPGLFNSFYANDGTNFVQRLEPSVLYVAPETCDVEFISDNKPRQDIDFYLCSIYTRGWNEFKEFSNKVGKDKIVAGGYHATALPQEVYKYASKVIEGYCGNIDEIIHSPFPGIFRGEFKFTHLKRDLIDLRQMKQVYPDIDNTDISGSMVSSVGCPYDCDFCSTPNMSGKSMKTSSIKYVEQEIEDLLQNGATTVFIRDESFATNPMLKEFAVLFKDKFKVLYSFGTGAVMAKREDLVKHLVENSWHSLNFGLEDIGVKYRKNRSLKEATDNCIRNGMKYVMSFIVNDDGKTIEEARMNYKSVI